MARPNVSLEQLISEWEPQLRASFTDSVYNLRNTAQVDQIVRMLQAGDVDGALRAVGLDPVSFRAFDKTFDATFEAGGVHTAAVVPPVADATGFRSVFQFNIRNPQAENWLRTYSSQLITEILDDQRNMIRGVLTAGMEAGANPNTTALDLVGRINRATGQREGGLIGLTDSQAKWVQAYQAELESDNPAAALSRALRDQRFDVSVANAAAEGRPVEQGLVNSMVTAYRNRALRYRAETIARSEAITALHQAQDFSMQQAVQSGKVAHDQVSYIWRSAHDKRVRDAHRELDGQVAKMGVPFQSSLGPIRFPGDPTATAANTINCRCFREPKIDFLAGIK